MIVVDGLTVDEQILVNGLMGQLDAHRRKNELRQAFMDCRHIPVPPPTVPGYLRNIQFVLGWPAKAVESLARRVRLTGMSIPGSEMADFGLDEIVDENEYIAQSRMAQLAAFEQGVSWLVASGGDESAGEPPVLITRQNALDGTGIWDPRLRRMTSFLSIRARSNDGNVTGFTLYTGNQVIIALNGAVVSRQDWPYLRIPVEPLIYRQRDTRPFGSSRISRPIMKITDSAVRAVMRSEGTADFYSSPLIALFGPDESVFNNTPPMKLLLSSIFAIPDNDDNTAQNPRADLKQLQQASQQPHISQLQVWAQLFAAEASIPVSSLGVGMVQANPTSDESYIASREDLISEAEDAQDGFSRAHVRILQDAWMITNRSSDLPSELRKLTPVWRDPRHESQAGAADWLTKVASVLPWVAESDTVLDLIGLPEDTVTRLKADHAQAQARAALAALAGQPVTTVNPSNS